MRRLFDNKTFLITLTIIVAAGFLAEQVYFVVDSNRQAQAVATHTVQPRTLSGHINAILYDVMGNSDRGIQRFHIDSLTPDPHFPGLKDLTVHWAINFDLSAGSVGRGAQMDVYYSLERLYQAHVPLATIRMIGTFANKNAKGQYFEQRVLDVSLTKPVADLIVWNTIDDQTLWPILHHAYTMPGFLCNCTE